MASVPNYRGMFLRGYGSQSHTKNNGSAVGNTATNHASGSIGSIQGDAARYFNFGGTIRMLQSSTLEVETVYGDAVEVSKTDKNSNYTKMVAGTGTGHVTYTVRNSHINPTANENRPVNIAVRYLIRSR